MFNVNRRNNQILYDTQGEAWSETRILAVTPGAYELTEIAELIIEETNGNVIIEPDKNTIKFLMEIKQGALSFDIENSIAPLLGFRKMVNEQCKYTSQKIIHIMGFSIINIHCNVLSGVKDNCKDTDILYTFYSNRTPRLLDKYYTN